MKVEALILVAVIGLGALEWRDHRVLDKVIASESAATSRDAEARSLEFSERCERSAKSLFEEGRPRPDPHDVNDDFTSHYNNARKRCFMETYTVSSMPHGVMISGSLSDAVERKDYGTLLITGDGPGMRVIQCRVGLVDVDDHPCKSEDEFKRLASKYMTE